MWTNSTGNSDFAETHWTMIGQAIHEDPLNGRPALAKLISAYFEALYHHLVVKKRLVENDADDILQGFFHEKLIEGNLLEHANRRDGKFRALLIRTLENYLIDQWRRRQKDASLLASLEFQDDWDAPQLASTEPLDRFEVEWAKQLLELALERMRDECAQHGRPELWQLFTGRLIHPALCGLPEKSYQELQLQFGWQSPKQAADHLTTAKRMFARILRKVIGEYRSTPEGIEEEVAELDAVLAAAVRGGWSLSLPLPQSGSSIFKRGSSIMKSGNSVVFGIVEQTPETWSHESLASQVAQQLATSLADDLAVHFPADTWRAATKAADAASPPVNTYGELFAHDRPPVLLLQLVKEFAKHCVAADPPLLPKPVADFLYVAAVLAAVAGGDKSISTKPAVLIRRDGLLLTQQTWLQGAPQRLVQQLLAQLKVD